MPATGTAVAWAEGTRGTSNLGHDEGHQPQRVSIKPSSSRDSGICCGDPRSRSPSSRSWARTWSAGDNSSSTSRPEARAGSGTKLLGSVSSPRRTAYALPPEHRIDPAMLQYTLWLALEDVDCDNGALRIARGSYRDDRLEKLADLIVAEPLKALNPSRPRSSSSATAPTSSTRFTRYSAGSSRVVTTYSPTASFGPIPCGRERVSSSRR